MLTDDFSDGKCLIGIEEIMTVIARGYIFSEGRLLYDDLGKINEKIIYDTIELLHRWTGFADIEIRKRTDNSELDKWMKRHSVVDSWLKKYWKYWLGLKDKKISSSDKELKWELLEKEWNEKLNSPMDYQANKITYNNIIANALEKGPLRNRYFAMKKSQEHIGKNVILSDKERFKHFLYKSGAHDTTYNKVLKIICTYLLFLERYPKGQKQVWVKSSELSRWYGLDDGGNGWYPDDIEWKQKPIYITNMIRNNLTKLMVDPEYLETFDFRIIERDEISKYRNEYWILEDCGHGLKECWLVK